MAGKRIFWRGRERQRERERERERGTVDLLTFVYTVSFSSFLFLKSNVSGFLAICLCFKMPLS